jgi:carbamoyltransferase
VAPVADPDATHYKEIVRGWQRVFEQVTGLGPARRPLGTDPSTCRTFRRAPQPSQEYRDLAASGQARLVSDVVELAREALRLTGEPLLALSGGVALNCSMNGRIETAISPAELHVQPACNDSGVALGAACWAALTHGSRVRAPAAHVYRGPSFPRGSVADQLREWNVAFEDAEDPYPAAGALLAAGKTVALFEGGAEFGPRALGSRSILADASRPEMLDRVNAVKGRESWRPLGPALRREEAAKAFGRDVSGEFMLVARAVEDAYRSAMPATVHVDGTSRAQIVHQELAPGLYRLVAETQDRTGTPALINTSFNVRGPIVLTPKDAMATFATSGLDALLIEGHLVCK